MTLRWGTPPVAFVLFTVILVALLAWGFLRASRNQRIHWVRRTILVAMCLIIGITPAVPSGVKEEVNNIEVFFVLDRSISMVAMDQDGDHPRLEAATSDIKELTNDLAGSRYAAITFASNSQSALPLTTDAHAVKSWADTVIPESPLYASGSSVESVTHTLNTELTKAKERHPANIRLVFLMTDGENTVDPSSQTDQQILPWTDLKPLIDGGMVLGYGTEQGGKMHDTTNLTSDGWDSLKNARFIMDPETGKEAISKANPQHLKEIADQLGLQFEMRSGKPDFKDAVKKMTEHAKQVALADNRSETKLYREFVWPFVWVAIAMMLWELLYLGNRFRKLKEDKRR